MSSSVDSPGPSAFIPLVGLVGGVGSGKSTLAHGLAQRMSVAILDADRAGHEALRQSAVKVALRQAFGESIFNDSQEIVRSQLAALVFGSDDQSQRERRTLELRPHGYMLSSGCAVVNVRETCRGGTSFAEMVFEGETMRRQTPPDYLGGPQAIPAWRAFP